MLAPQKTRYKTTSPGRKLLNIKGEWIAMRQGQLTGIPSDAHRVAALALARKKWQFFLQACSLWTCVHVTCTACAMARDLMLVNAFGLPPVGQPVVQTRPQAISSGGSQPYWIVGSKSSLWSRSTSGTAVSVCRSQVAARASAVEARRSIRASARSVNSRTARLTSP